MNYFSRVRKLTPTKFWVNNVTREEADLGIRNGASGCTQNPSYTWKMLSSIDEKEYAMKLLHDAMKESDDNNEVVSILQRKLVKGISDRFMPLYEKSHGRWGYVSIQGDPINEENTDVILNEAYKSRKLNPNIMVKVPATKAGLKAIEVLLADDTPINATEVMGVDQVIALGEIYSRVGEHTGKRPVMFFSLITGIYNEWIRREVESARIDVNSDALYQAGMVIAKKAYSLNAERGYGMGFISGGARSLDDFYEMVGGDVCVTMNWKGYCDKLIEKDSPVISRLFNPVQESVLDELNTKLLQFRQAYWAGSLTVDDFEHYGPVEYFRDSFVEAWKNALDFVEETRKT
ncbi:transaldolase family protein [Marispirochaeta aestuarii]|uniref:transaldolase family protein n=1 Tax=Marispirochaeta aestuarii TaxID=1963862 RepID=UPI0029C6A4F6|nr:transaldolase family protein [Marispirochaeta aestuarii]